VARLFSSFPVGSILGIQVRVHTLLVALLVFVGFAFSNEPVALIGLAILMVVLLLHELGHSLVARRFGIEVIDITLWPLGGMARMKVVPESPRIEGLLAAAGPAVNLALAMIGAPIWFAVMLSTRDGSMWRDVAGGFVAINVVMCVFNMLPIFPTDGGRILRALLALRTDWVSATYQAVIVSRVLAVALGLAGVFVLHDWMVPLVALWLWSMGTIELAQVRARHANENARADARSFDGASLEGTPREPRSRSEAWTDAAAAPTNATTARFTDEEIERLEKFRGRLRPDDTST